MLIIFGGLPGVGKTALAVELARLIGAVHLRIDSIDLLQLRRTILAAVPAEYDGFQRYWTEN